MPMQPVGSPMQGTVVSIDIAEGDVVRVGQQLVVLESMKMEHIVAAEWSGVVTSIRIAVGETVMTGDPLVFVEVGAATSSEERGIDATGDLARVRGDLAEVVG